MENPLFKKKHKCTTRPKINKKLLKMSPKSEQGKKVHF